MHICTYEYEELTMLKVFENLNFSTGANQKYKAMQCRQAVLI